MCRDCRDLLVDPWWQESLSHLGLTPTSGQIIDDRANTVPYPISTYLLLTKFTVLTQRWEKSINVHQQVF